MTATTTPPITFASADSADPETDAVWEACRQHWLNAVFARSGRNETRRAYAHDTAEFARFVAPVRPWEIRRVHVRQWIDSMRAGGLSEATINRRLAALWAFYDFAANEYELWSAPNPFAGRALRTTIDPYARSRFMTTEECIRLFAAIDSGTPTGLRDLCIFFGMFATTRRVSEWLNLRLGDIHREDGTTWFAYRYKGGQTRRQVIPPALWDLLDRHVARSGRSAPESYLFVATTAAARHFASTRPGYDPASQPLSASWINRLLKVYGIPLGIAPERLHAHSLRHAGARYREEHGASLEQLRDVLGHTNLKTTQIYAGRVLTVPVDEFGAVVGDVLRLPPSYHDTAHLSRNRQQTGSKEEKLA